MSAKPRTMPRDLVLPVRLARWPHAKARRLPPNVTVIRIPLENSTLSKTAWRWGQSRANPSLVKFPDNPRFTGKNCELTGNTREHALIYRVVSASYGQIP